MREIWHISANASIVGKISEASDTLETTMEKLYSGEFAHDLDDEA